MYSQKRYTSPSHIGRIMYKYGKVLDSIYQNKDLTDFTYDEVLEFFDSKNPEKDLDDLIEYGTLVRYGDNISLSDNWMQFLEAELHDNEVISAGYEEILRDIENKLTLIRQSVMQSERDKYIMKTKRAFGGLAEKNQIKINDLARNVRETYKYERNKDNKLLLLVSYQETANAMRLAMQEAIQFIEKRSGLIFDIINHPRLTAIVKQVRTLIGMQFGEFASVEKTISMYVNRIETSNRNLKKFQDIARCIKNGTWKAATNIPALVEECNDLYLEPISRNMSLPSIDWLSETEEGLILTEKIRDINKVKISKRKEVPVPFTDEELSDRNSSMDIPNVQSLINAFKLSGDDLMTFLRKSTLMKDKTDKEIAHYYLYVLGYATDELYYTEQYSEFLNSLFMVITSK